MNITFSQDYALLVGAGADLPNTIDDARGIANILQDPARCAYPATATKSAPQLASATS